MGWNGSNIRRTHDKYKPPKDTSIYKSLFIGVSVVLILMTVWILSRSNVEQHNTSPAERKQTTSKKSKTPQKNKRKTTIAQRNYPASSIVLPDSNNVNHIWANAKGLDPALFPYTDGRKVIRTNTNKWMAVDICIMPNGTRRKVRRNVSKQLFSCVTDQILLQALSTGGDEAGPPIPFSEDMEDDFLESLKKPIVISEDDAPEQREIKEQVLLAREAVMDQINEGRSFFEAVTEHIQTQASNQSARETVMDAVEELKTNGESDLIEKYLEESNKILQGMGASPISIQDVSEDE